MLRVTSSGVDTTQLPTTAMSTTQEDARMSSTAAQSAETVDADQLDWKAIFDSLDNEYWEPVSSSQLAMMVSIEADDITDEQEAGQRMLDAVEAGHLEKHSAGYTIAGVEPPEKADERDTTTDTVTDGQTDDSSPQEEHDTDQTPDDVAEMPRPELEQEVRDLRSRVASVERKVEEFPAMIMAFRNLFGDVPLEDLPDAASQLNDRLEQQDEIIREVSDKLNAIDDLTRGKQETTESRVVQLRRYLVEQAEEKGGTYGMTYNQIHSYFGGEISESWASQLQTKVAEGHEAFFTRKTTGKTTVCVNLDKVDERSIYRLKNSEESKGA